MRFSLPRLLIFLMVVCAIPFETVAEDQVSGNQKVLLTSDKKAPSLQPSGNPPYLDRQFQPRSQESQEIERELMEERDRQNQQQNNHLKEKEGLVNKYEASLLEAEKALEKKLSQQKNTYQNLLDKMHDTHREILEQQQAHHLGLLQKEHQKYKVLQDLHEQEQQR